ncbi:hypothetical protein [Lacticaseibacillus daqingensis]|uniref:hypothetical protein n=1 Tax=Lacticaseibacillus daqingensis TaxID=2486014 RepID=UPI000F79366F|nr:hypothetical protein [Lacticaseibacillus daqingensis]
MAILRLIWRRHRWLWLVAALLMVLYGGSVVDQAHKTHTAMQKEMMTPVRFDRELKKPKDERSTDARTYTEYRDDTLMLYHEQLNVVDDTAMLPTTYGIQPLRVDFFYLGGIFLLGVVVAAWDHYSRFDRFLMAAGLTRRRTYWTRAGLFFGLVVLGTVLVDTGIVGGLYALLPAHDVNLSLQQAFGLTLYNTTLAALCFAVGQLYGLLCGRLWLLAALVPLTLASANQTLQNLGVLFGQTFVKANVSWPRVDNPLWAYWPFVIGFVLVTGICLGLAAWGFTHLSLEHDGTALMVPALRPLVIGIGMVVAFALFMGTDDHGHFVWQSSLFAPLLTLALGVLWAQWSRLTAAIARRRAAA